MIGFKKCLVAALVSVACAQAWAVPTLSLTATPSTAAPGSQVNVAVMVSDVADLASYQFSLSFNASVLSLASYMEGNFLGTAGSTYADGGTLDANAGTISFAFGALFGTDPGASGSGVVANYTFNTLSAGLSALTFSDVLLLTSSGGDIATTIVNGSVNVEAPVIPPPTGDVPEPASWMLMGVGLVAAGALRRRSVGGMAAQA